MPSLPLPPLQTFLAIVGLMIAFAALRLVSPRWTLERSEALVHGILGGVVFVAGIVLTAMWRQPGFLLVSLGGVVLAVLAARELRGE